ASRSAATDNSLLLGSAADGQIGNQAGKMIVKTKLTPRRARNDMRDHPEFKARQPFVFRQSSDTIATYDRMPGRARPASRQDTLAAAACAPRQGLHYSNTGVWNGWRTLGYPVSVCELGTKRIVPSARDGSRWNSPTNKIRVYQMTHRRGRAARAHVNAERLC